MSSIFTARQHVSVAEMKSTVSAIIGLLLQAWSFYRAMHYSAKRGIAIACHPSVCPSVCPSLTLVHHDHIWLEILETNCTNT